MSTIYSFIFGYTASRQTCSLESLRSALSPTNSAEAMSHSISKDHLSDASFRTFRVLSGKYIA